MYKVCSIKHCLPSWFQAGPRRPFCKQWFKYAAMVVVFKLDPNWILRPPKWLGHQKLWEKPVPFVKQNSFNFSMTADSRAVTTTTTTQSTGRILWTVSVRPRMFWKTLTGPRITGIERNSSLILMMYSLWMASSIREIKKMTNSCSFLAPNWNLK